MPIKPGKDEDQSAWMGRCVAEMIGTGDDKRPQDQAVAACMQLWRDKDKQFDDYDEEDVPEPDDGESREDFLDRCTSELSDAGMDDDRAEDMCAMAWEEYGNGDDYDGVFDFAAGKLVRKTYAKKALGGEYILSDNSVDSFGDIVSSEGWDTSAFERNPVALFNHVSSWPIGTWSAIRVENGQLRGRLELAPKGTSPRIDEIRALVEAGILRAVSVGFRALEHEPLKSADGATLGMRFIKQQLLEASLVSIPANSNALAVAKSLNVSPQTLRLVFAKQGKKGRTLRRGLHGKHANISSGNGKGRGMSSLAQRITELQSQIVSKTDTLTAHLDRLDDSNVSDADLETTSTLNTEIAQLKKTHLALVESEKLIGAAADGHGEVTPRGRALVTTGFTKVNDRETPSPRPPGAPAVLRDRSKDLDPLEYLVRAGTAMRMAKHWNIPPDQARERIYGADRVGQDEAHATWIACALTFGPQSVADELVLRAYGSRHLTDEQFYTRAASAPAFTTVAGWAQELVRQIYTDLMPLLIPSSILPRLSAKGLALSFGRAGRIVIPTRNATPTLAGSFVGEGQAIPVRQGGFSSQTLVPKKVGVITAWSKELDEYSIPAIEGVLRDALQVDTAVAVDTILIDANPATVIRPAGLLNGLTTQTPTPLGTGNQPVLTALVGDLNVLIGALAQSTKGNIRSPVWLLNPQEVLGASLALSALGDFPFRDEIARGTLNNIPFIDSTVVPRNTVILIDAADFVVVGAEGIRMDLSDQATIHMEDTSPTDLVGVGSPPVVAAPQRSLFQTDSIALRMIFFLNWVQRRAGTIFFTAGVNW